MRFCKASVAWAIFSLLAAPFAAHAAPTVFFNAPVDGQTISGILRYSSACEVGQLDQPRKVLPRRVSAQHRQQCALAVQLRYD